MRAPPTGREEHSADNLWKNEEGDEPAPHEEPEVDIVPQRDKGKHHQEVPDVLELGHES